MPEPDVELYDTTLRDGAQMVGLAFSLEDKLKILHAVDGLGVPYVEGGWPGANPKDTEFFRLANRERLAHTTLTAFGMCRRPRERAAESPLVQDLLDAETEVVCVVGKTWDLHVTETLRTMLAEGIAMIADTIAFLSGEGRRVFFDAEHFFDGYRANPAFALACLRAAEEAGAERLVLCDTNGGTLPADVARIVTEVGGQVSVPLGVHCHDDAGCAVASSLAAVEANAFQVQGTLNGYGERCGNANLLTIAANLELKLGRHALPRGSLDRLTEIAHFVAEVANIPPNGQQPYVGRNAFAHKAGLHTSALARRPGAYEHVPPRSVGNDGQMVVSELAGRAAVLRKAGELGVRLTSEEADKALARVKEREGEGYTFEAADASLALLLARSNGSGDGRGRFFELESFRVLVEKREGDGTMAEATVKVRAGGRRHIATAEGAGPVGALDNAIRVALAGVFPELDDMTLTDYRVRVLDSKKGTQAVVRVLIETSDGEKAWSTVGVSDNIIEASWEALAESLVYGLLHPRRQEQAASS
jgi:2-isopropylmalate synthase